MLQARCPFCQQKLQLPERLPAGAMLQCAGCANQFLPPVLSDSTEIQPVRRKKKKQPSNSSREWSKRSIILMASLVSITFLLGILLVIWLMQPGYARFNEQITSHYNKFSEIVATNINPKPINNLPLFLKQFQKISPQLKALQEEVKSIRAPEDQQQLLGMLTSLIDSMTKFCQTDAPRFLEEFKHKPNNESTASEMVRALYHISTLHDALVVSQKTLAQRNNLPIINLRPDAPFFFSLPGN